jgi:hypothetical protein
METAAKKADGEMADERSTDLIQNECVMQLYARTRRAGVGCR